jgi:hypothetical protein
MSYEFWVKQYELVAESASRGDLNPMRKIDGRSDS